VLIFSKTALQINIHIFLTRCALAIQAKYGTDLSQLDDQKLKKDQKKAP
jgi:hypothetical protein